MGSVRHEAKSSRRSGSRRTYLFCFAGPDFQGGGCAAFVSGLAGRRRRRGQFASSQAITRTYDAILKLLSLCTMRVTADLSLSAFLLISVWEMPVTSTNAWTLHCNARRRSPAVGYFFAISESLVGQDHADLSDTSDCVNARGCDTSDSPTRQSPHSQQKFPEKH
jgi:hypothetical protein